MPTYGMGAEGLLVASNADQIIQQIRLSPKCNDVRIVRSGDGQTLTFQYEAVNQQAAETISSEIHSILSRFTSEFCGL